tara:strand:- start:34466 stop:37042 length:2577 start_codon:yes stop_codon:yes gene_type:complete
MIGKIKPIDTSIRSTKNVEGDLILVEMGSAYDEVLTYPEYGMFGEFSDRTYPEFKNSDNVAVGGSKLATDTVENQEKNIANKTPANEKLAGDEVAPIKKEEVQSKVLKIVPGLDLPLENPLNDFASYNYVYTIGCLTNDELNNPDSTYRMKDPQNVLLKTGGSSGVKGIARTAYEQNGVKLEYFIDNLEIQTFIAPNPKSRNTQATSFQFEVHEPYSMGLFLQTLQLCSLKAGHENYLQAPYVLIIEFKGWDSDGNPIYPDSSLGMRKVMPFKWTNAGFSVEASGSVYNVKGVPWNDVAFSDQVQKLPIDVQVSGNNLEELCQSGAKSIATVLNTHLLEQKEKGDVVEPDEYVILFPTAGSFASNKNSVGTNDSASQNSATVSNDGSSAGTAPKVTTQEAWQSITGQEGEVPANFDEFLSKQLGFTVLRSKVSEGIKSRGTAKVNINEIGNGEIAKGRFEYGAAGAAPFGLAKFTYNKEQGIFERGKIKIIPGKNMEIKFPQGMTIQKILEELVIMSDYGQKIGTNAPTDEMGFKDWFKIESSVYNVTNKEQEKKSGRPPRVYVYKVIPYKVHSSKFAPPTAPAKGTETLEKQCVKQYNYIYTGANKDVLSFDININTAFYTSIAKNTDNSGTNKIETSGTAEDVSDTNFVQSDGTDSTLKDGVGASLPDVENKSDSAGAVPETPEMAVARRFHNAIIDSGSDLVTADMEIWGDPYFIADSGMGNYNSEPLPGTINLNADGSINYQSGEVDCVVNFRTPVDFGDNGIMTFPESTIKVNAFSGVYQIVKVTNVFQGGQFKQTLNMVRRRNQLTNVSATDSDTQAYQEGKKKDEVGNEVKADGTTTTDTNQEARGGEILT